MFFNLGSYFLVQILMNVMQAVMTVLKTPGVLTRMVVTAVSVETGILVTVMPVKVSVWVQGSP